jgi:hypothetical protein
MADRSHSPEESEDIRAGHELSDLEPEKIALFGAVLAVTIVAVLVATYVLFNQFYASDRSRQAAPSPLSFTPEPIPEPRLLVTPGQDLNAMRAAEDSLLNSYGWIDREKGIARIPIQEAIEILAQRGLPARPESEQKKK